MSFFARRRARRISSVAQEVAGFLRSDEVKSIRFMYRSFLIYEGAWSKLASAIETAGCGVGVDVNRRAVRKAKAAAFYDPNPGKNTIVLKSFHPLRTAMGRGIIVHEAVHAIIDGQDRGTIDAFHNEAAAEVAKYWYHVNAGTPTKSDSAQALLDLAGSIKARQSSSTPVFVTSDEKEQWEAHARRKWHKHYGEHTQGNSDGWD